MPLVMTVQSSPESSRLRELAESEVRLATSGYVL